MAKFDLHLHSNNSDGSDTVFELVDNVKKSGIKIFALTDHDTVEGVNEADRLTTSEIKFIKGVELTCIAKGIKCHILGYNINPQSKELTELIELGKKLRRIKLEGRIKYLKEVWNIELTKDELDWLYSRKSVVKTHIANILVNRGLSDNNVDAMKKYLDGYHAPNTRFDGEKAIKIIKGAGGVAVWAHPLGGEGEEHISEQEFIPKLEKMIKCGIQGLECYYSRYSIQEIEFLKNCAQKHNLLISGGSDYHGSNKTVPIGRLNISDKNVDSGEINILKILGK